ncbi:MAG: hypothetical protein ACREK4_17610, partial [Candidatus Rokuibacteriota bacterium]
LVGAPGAALGQVFIATQPKPEFTIGPLSVRANVGPGHGPVEVSVLFGLVVPPTAGGGALAQDLYLLWPGEVDAEPVPGAPDPEIRRTIEGRGFQVTREGRLPLTARAIYSGRDRPKAEPIAGGAPFVAYSREPGPLGQGAPASWIRIPWTPRLGDREWLVELRMRLTGLRRQKQATWLEHTLWGERHVVTLSFNDVRTRATFPMYLAHRDRVVRLADDPSQLVINFADADHLKIHEVYPGSSQRRPSETRRATEIVSAYLDPSEGIRPQVLTVQFGYFTGWKAWSPLLFAALFFVLGNLAGPLVTMLVKTVSARLQGRIQFGPPGDAPGRRETGTIIPREALARLAPGETTYAQVLDLCGPDPEERERLSPPGRRTLVYRGRRMVPHRPRRLGWLATVNRWDIEHHEVEIELEGDRVLDVQAQVNRSRLSQPGAV